MDEKLVGSTMSGDNRIWQPNVEPTETILPEPGSLDEQQQEQQFYTKTSLTASSSTSNQESIRALNREILSASQAYNSTPKPFKRVHSPLISSTTSTTTDLAFERQRRDELLQQVKQHQFGGSSNQAGRATFDNSAQTSTADQGSQQEENMAPKLVHKQYNSPIDLYSMNNIRRTIEAHSEIIVPGVKGINFMKSDAPVNKQSEVYKLVMEEEQASRRAQQEGCGQTCAPRLSPVASGQAQSASGFHPTQHQQEQQEIEPKTKIQVSSEPKRFYTTTTGGQTQEAAKFGPQSSGAPACCECGQFIVGPFAKIQNRYVHPHCFNCTTCGTSLKNTGYFTVNEKLYCDIHAKQVANMMRIQYDFGGQTASSAAAAPPPPPPPTRVANNQQSPVVSSTTRGNARPLGGQFRQLSSDSAATISTMFADRRANSTESHDQQVKWSWRPVIGKEGSAATSQGPVCASSTATTTISHQHHQDTSQKQQQQQPQRQQLVAGGPSSGNRVPICVHCHVQIQGPYILAGKTTWCKSCSQSHFNCSSCRRSLLDIGFIEDSSHNYYCELCFEAYYAPICSKCQIRIKGDCLNALGKQWHPSCFVCGHCRRPFGNSSFYLEDNLPYCERDWNALFTTKCHACNYPIEAGDKWIEALEMNYHSNCFRCSSCQCNLEGSTFYCKGGKPFCRLHAR